MDQVCHSVGLKNEEVEIRLGKVKVEVKKDLLFRL